MTQKRKELLAARNEKLWLLLTYATNKETNRIELKRELTDDLDIEKLLNNGLYEYN